MAFLLILSQLRANARYSKRIGVKAKLFRCKIRRDGQHTRKVVEKHSFKSLTKLYSELTFAGWTIRMEVIGDCDVDMDIDMVDSSFFKSSICASTVLRKNFTSDWPQSR